LGVLKNITDLPRVFWLILFFIPRAKVSTSEHHHKDHLVREPGIKKRESHMNSDEVIDTHAVSAIVLVLDVLVNLEVSVELQD
jgi:hypothetical protein